jgi:hypothetical protein
MKTADINLMILALMVALFVTSAWGSDTHMYETNDAQAVYEALLDANIKTLVQDITSTPTLTADHLRNRIKGLDRDTAADFIYKNKQPMSLTELLEGRSRWTFLPRAEMNEFFGGYPQKGWEAFHAKYPGEYGFTSFSRIGFSARGTQALVMVGLHCGPLCGQGWYFLLSKTNGRWKVKREEEAWISRGSELCPAPHGRIQQSTQDLLLKQAPCAAELAVAPEPAQRRRSGSPNGLARAR